MSALYSSPEPIEVGQRVVAERHVIDPAPQVGTVHDYDHEGFTVEFDDPELGVVGFDWCTWTSGDVRRVASLSTGGCDLCAAGVMHRHDEESPMTT